MAPIIRIIFKLTMPVVNFLIFNICVGQTRGKAPTIKYYLQSAQVGKETSR